MKKAKKVLAAVLGLAMTFATSVMTFAETPAATIKPTVSADGKTVSVQVIAPAGLPGTFDYGVSFDPSKVEYVETEFNKAVLERKVTEDDVKNQTSDGETDWSKAVGKTLFMTLMDNYDTSVGDNFVALAFAAALDNPGIEAGTLLATVKFNVKDAAAGPGTFNVVSDSMDKVDAGETIATPDDTTGVVPVTEAPAASEDTPSASTAADASAAPEASAASDNNNGGKSDNNVDNANKNNTDNNAASAAADNKTVDSATKSSAPNSSAAAAGSKAPAASTAAKTTTPKTADTASVVVPVVAIVAAAAAVVAVSKKKVEE